MESEMKELRDEIRNLKVSVVTLTWSIAACRPGGPYWNYNMYFSI